MPPLAAVAANCSAEGNAITGKFIAQHVKSSFVITARGADNLQCAAGGETFIVKVRGQGRVDPPPVRDRGDGTYEVELTYPQSGPYEVVVSLGKGAQVKGSPFKLTVNAAQRPPPPPPPSLGAAEGGAPTLCWAEPEHTGGMPITAFTLWRLPPGAKKEAAEVLQQATPSERSIPLPLAPGAPAASCYYGYLVSCTNAKGESERSEPGPRPAPFDPSSFAAERAGLLACFDETKAMRARGEDELPPTAFTQAAADSPAVRRARGTRRESIVPGLVQRIDDVAAAMGGPSRRPSAFTLAPADVEAAADGEVQVALLLHVWDVLCPTGEAQAPPEELPKPATILACAFNDPEGGKILADPTAAPFLAWLRGLAEGEAAERPVVVPRSRRRRAARCGRCARSAWWRPMLRGWRSWRRRWRRWRVKWRRLA